ncbi:alpha/beta fold hydrolase [Kaustia mangrovi]|uniref:Alpha/beta fold hydrolase n=1 Tax=Kaustia mangrovi TaxID=2593653 RepID=A0A7S8HBM6_9HYPH|nr:alpha/beta fold hydrolase [Kaustia mangrovi]QPC42735.1 alpha/beta fold hydrolase [Kaustia mangrovi]
MDSTDQVSAIGRHAMQAITGEAMEGILATVGSHSPQLVNNLVTHAFGSVIADPALGYGARELATIAMLGAMGGCESQLRTHLGFALDCGLTPEEIVASAEHVSVYAGYPRALTMLRIAREVLKDRGEKLLVAQPFRLRDHATRVFDSGGDGPPMVLLHALGLDWRMWSHVIPLLTPHYRVIAFDLRGFGRATFAPQVRDLAHYAEDVADLLDRLELPQAHVAGLSLGGSIALELALRRPDLVEGLTVIAATAWSFPAFEERARAAETAGMEAQVVPSLARWFRASDLARNGWAVRYARNCVRRASISDWSAAWRTLAGISLDGRLGDIRTPIRIIAGESDQSTPPSLMEGLIPASRRDFAILPDAPHMLALTHPEELGRAILADPCSDT